MKSPAYHVLSISAVLFFGLLNSAEYSVQAGDKVQISLSSVGSSFSYGGVALKKGFFKAEGLDVELIQMRGNVAMAALAAEHLDYTLMFGSVVRAALSGFPYKVLASFTNGPTNVLVGRSEFSGVQDLRGHTVGISSFGAGVHITAELMVRNLGINPAEVKFVAVGNDAARLANLEKNLVDFALVSPAAATRAERIGLKIIARAYEHLVFPFAGLGASEKKVKKEPDKTKRVIKALINASRYIREEREGTIQILMDWAKEGKGSATDLYEVLRKISSEDGSIPQKGLQLVIEQAKKELKLSREVAFSEVVDESILIEAQKELKIKGR